MDGKRYALNSNGHEVLGTKWVAIVPLHRRGFAVTRKHLGIDVSNPALQVLSGEYVELRSRSPPDEVGESGTLVVRDPPHGEPQVKNTG